MTLPYFTLGYDFIVTYKGEANLTLRRRFPMAKRGRPKRSNPQAERKIFTAELASCPACGEALTSVGNSAHSIKTVQTFAGEFQVVAYSRLCGNSDCDQYRTHYHAVGHLQVALPGET